jgi:hypothetical protein
MHKYDVPAFYRHGGGRILGLNGHRIDHEASPIGAPIVIVPIQSKEVRYSDAVFVRAFNSTVPVRLDRQMAWHPWQDVIAFDEGDEVMAPSVEVEDEGARVMNQLKAYEQQLQRARPLLFMLTSNRNRTTLTCGWILSPSRKRCCKSR